MNCKLCKSRMKKPRYGYCVNCTNADFAGIRKRIIKDGNAPSHKCKCGCGDLAYFNAKYVKHHQPHAKGWKQSAYQKAQARKAASRPKTAEHCRNISLGRKASTKPSSFLGKHHSKASKLKMSRALKGRVSTFLGKHHTDANKRIFSINMSKRLCEGHNHWRRFKYEGELASFWMRSSWEVAFAQYLDELEWTWLYESRTFELSCGCYTPDFFIPHSGTFVEIKGAIFPHFIKRMKAFKKETGYCLLVLYEKDLKDLGVSI